MSQSGFLNKNAKKLGLNEADLQRELMFRKMVLEWMVRQGIRKQSDVANVIREFYANPSRVIQKARVGMK